MAPSIRIAKSPDASSVLDGRDRKLRTFVVVRSSNRQTGALNIRPARVQQGAGGSDTERLCSLVNQEIAVRRTKMRVHGIYAVEMAETYILSNIHPLMIRLATIHERNRVPAFKVRPEYVEREMVRASGIPARGLVENKRIIARTSDRDRRKGWTVGWDRSGSEIKTVFGRIDHDGATVSIAGERKRRIGIVPHERKVCCVILSIADRQDSSRRIACKRNRCPRSK